ncbi:MAG: hypothetical protein VKK04_08960 [Synechococcales bacterium]|nr:hypothetical protein [Synechococcales bacterium]
MKRSLLQRLKSWFVADVPNDVAACEFECRKLDCSEQEWEECKRRQDIEQRLQNATSPSADH